MEKIFNEIVMSDLQKMNELVQKGWFETTDFNEAAINLSNSLAAYHQEVSSCENYKKEVCADKSMMAKGA